MSGRGLPAHTGLIRPIAALTFDPAAWLAAYRTRTAAQVASNRITESQEISSPVRDSHYSHESQGVDVKSERDYPVTDSKASEIAAVRHQKRTYCQSWHSRQSELHRKQVFLKACLGVRMSREYHGFSEATKRASDEAIQRLQKEIEAISNPDPKIIVKSEGCG